MVGKKTSKSMSALKQQQPQQQNQSLHEHLRLKTKKEELRRVAQLRLAGRLGSGQSSGSESEYESPPTIEDEVIVDNKVDNPAANEDILLRILVASTKAMCDCILNAKKSNQPLAIKEGVFVVEHALDELVKLKARRETPKENPNKAKRDEKKRKRDGEDSTSPPGLKQAVKRPKESKPKVTEAKADGKWQVALSKKTKRQEQKRAKQGQEEKSEGPIQGRLPRVRAKPDAILVVPAQGSNYAEVLKKMKSVPKDQIGVDVRKTRETKKGGILVELGNTTPENRKKFAEVITSAVSTHGAVLSLSPKVTYEIRDVDVTVEKKEIETSIKSHLPEGSSTEIVVKNG